MDPFERKASSDKQLRADFEVKLVQSDNAAQTAYLELRPDPRRYLEVTQDGERFYLDRYLGHQIGLREMARMASEMNGTPMFVPSRSIDSAPDYATRRRPAVEHELSTGEYLAPNEKARPHEKFSASSEVRDIVFLSVDICGATAYRLRNPKGFDLAYKIFIQELGTVVGHFNGSILKTQGDGFIAFIESPSFTIQCDSSIDLGLSFLVVLAETVNPALKAASLEPFLIRVGADYGPAETQRITIQATGFSQEEVVSDALNRSVKIEESCLPNQFRIGRSLYELIHVQWLERASEVSFDSSVVGIDNYKVYEIW
jgi:class 3 adenylate cyclase